MTRAHRHETRQYGAVSGGPPPGDRGTARRVRALFDPSPRAELAGAAEFLHSLLHGTGTPAGRAPAAVTVPTAPVHPVPAPGTSRALPDEGHRRVHP